MKQRGFVLVVVAAICYGTLGPLAELARADGIPSLAFAFGRASGAALALGVYLMVRWRAHAAVTWSRSVAWMVAAGGLLTATVNLALLGSFARTSVAVGLLIFYAYPALVAAAGVIWFREQLTRGQWGGLALAVAGAALVVAGPIQTLDGIGVGLAAFAALGGVIWVLIVRHGLGVLSPLMASAVMFGVAGTVLGVPCGLTGACAALVQPPDPQALVLVGLGALLSAALPTVLFLEGVRAIGASPASALATLEPVSGVLLAVVVLAQVPTPVQFLGGGMVVAAVLVLHVTTPRAALSAGNLA